MVDAAPYETLNMLFPLSRGQNGDPLHIQDGGWVVQNRDASPGNPLHDAVHMKQQGYGWNRREHTPVCPGQIFVAARSIDAGQIEQPAFFSSGEEKVVSPFAAAQHGNICFNVRGQHRKIAGD